MGMLTQYVLLSIGTKQKALPATWLAGLPK